MQGKNYHPTVCTCVCIFIHLFYSYARFYVGYISINGFCFYVCSTFMNHSGTFSTRLHSTRQVTTEEHIALIPLVHRGICTRSLNPKKIFSEASRIFSSTCFGPFMCAQTCSFSKNKRNGGVCIGNVTCKSPNRPLYCLGMRDRH